MTKPIEVRREHHSVDVGPPFKWHVMCGICPEAQGAYGTLPPYVCPDGCYPSREESLKGVRRHRAWHRRRGEE